MICGVPVAAIAEPHSVLRPGGALPEVLVDPAFLLSRYSLIRPIGFLLSPGLWANSDLWTPQEWLPSRSIGLALNSRFLILS